MTDGQFRALCALIREDGGDELQFSPAQLRKYYSQLLLHEKMAEHLAQSKFDKWVADGN